MQNIIYYPSVETWGEITKRPSWSESMLFESVRDIIRDVRKRGDEAVVDYTEIFDGVRNSSLKVATCEIQIAAQNCSEELKRAVSIAAENISKFHKAQYIDDVVVETMPGVKCSQKSVPIGRVGLYIPGGTAPLFSTLLMLAIPAIEAGCREIVVCTPPSKEGKISDELLYIAKLLGIEEIYKVGGVQAIAAMAYGTDTIKKVDKIFGPGNQYVNEAKVQVSRDVAIDMVAGPSEVMILADDTAVASFISADMLSQAEHGPDSQSILLTTSPSVAKQVSQLLEEQMSGLSRGDIINRSIKNSRIIVLSSVDEMIQYSNSYAPEHLILAIEGAERYCNKILNAGSVFLGNYSPETVGDYCSGTNHTLPTAGWAKSTGGVSLSSFLKRITFQEISKEGILLVGPIASVMADAEGLTAHKLAVDERVGNVLKG